MQIVLLFQLVEQSGSLAGLAFGINVNGVRRSSKRTARLSNVARSGRGRLVGRGRGFYLLASLVGINGGGNIAASPLPRSGRKRSHSSGARKTRVESVARGSGDEASARAGIPVGRSKVGAAKERSGIGTQTGRATGDDKESGDGLLVGSNEGSTLI